MKLKKLNRELYQDVITNTGRGAKMWAAPYFSLAPARLVAIHCGCAAASQPLRSNPARLKALLFEAFGEVAALQQTVGEQRDEIARLKGLKGRPIIKPSKPSGMDNATQPPEPGKPEKRRFRGKVTPRVKIEDQVVEVTVPEGSRFKGYEPFLVQDLVISATATCYQRERWVTPDGQTILAPLPEGIDGHFGPELRRFVLMQYHQGQTDTAPAGGTAALGGRGDLQAATATPADR